MPESSAATATEASRVGLSFLAPEPSAEEPQSSLHDAAPSRPQSRPNIVGQEWLVQAIEIDPVLGPVPAAEPAAEQPTTESTVKLAGL